MSQRHPSDCSCSLCQEDRLIERGSKRSLGSLFKQAEEQGLISEEPSFGSS